MFWNILFFIIGLLFLIFLIRCLSVYLVQRRGNEGGLVCLPNFFPLIGGAGGGIFLPLTYSLLVFAEHTPNNILGIIVCSACFLLFLSILVAWHNCTIQYDNQKFISKNFFGKKHVFSYEDITGYHGCRDTYLFCDKHTVMIDEASKNKDAFLCLANQKYRALHQGHTIPWTKKKFDPFNGNLENATQCLVAYIIVPMLLIAVFLFCLFTNFQTVNEQNTQHFTITFSDYRTDDGDLWLYSKENSHPFVVRQYLTSTEQTDFLFSNCNGEIKFSVYARLISPSHESPFYQVWNLSSGSQTFLSFEKAMIERRNDFPLVCTILGIFFFIDIIWSICSIVVIRNPKKYGRRIVHFFFRDNPLHY